MKYVLDTNAVSALMRGDAAIIEALRRVGKADVSVPHPVFAEIAYGIARLPRSRRRDRLRERLALLRDELSRAPWSDEVSDRFGEIKASLERAGARIEDLDVAIAAHARALGAVLVTADGRHMSRIDGLTIEDWSTSR